MKTKSKEFKIGEKIEIDAPAFRLNGKTGKVLGRPDKHTIELLIKEIGAQAGWKPDLYLVYFEYPDDYNIFTIKELACIHADSMKKSES